MLRRLYDWVLRLSAHPHAVWALAMVAFAESSFFPIPPDVMLMPMTLARREGAWRFAGIATIASVIGGAAGYLIGWGLFETLGQPILAFYGAQDQFASFAGRYNEYGAWIVLFAGLTPFPYKVITIASGATGLDFWVFMIASIVARGLRFYIVCGLLYWLGPPIRAFVERWLGLLFILFMVLLIGGFVAVRYLF